MNPSDTQDIMAALSALNQAQKTQASDLNELTRVVLALSKDLHEMTASMKEYAAKLQDSQIRTATHGKEFEMMAKSHAEIGAKIQEHEKVLDGLRSKHIYVAGAVTAIGFALSVTWGLISPHFKDVIAMEKRISILENEMQRIKNGKQSSLSSDAVLQAGECTEKGRGGCKPKPEKPEPLPVPPILDI